MVHMEGKPEMKFRAGGITATIWHNTGQGKNGPVEYRTVSVDRSYKADNDEWKHSTSFRQSDLPKVSLVLNKAYEYIMLSGKDSAEAL
ncbi:hypothetical protein J4464_01130 [Candidatus Woesearchaeota archaeon]|nr:hypothetical protein [Candidatus Woesearchaeota archaeon]